MKNKVIVKREKNELKFYLKNDSGEFWLFNQPDSESIYQWFKGGRSEREILGFTKWTQNKRLSYTIKRLPREIKYVTKYIIEDDERAA